MAKAKMTFPISQAELDVFRNKCIALELTQAEVARALFRSWVACGNGTFAVIPGDIAQMLMTMDAETLTFVLMQHEQRRRGNQEVSGD